VCEPARDSGTIENIAPNWRIDPKHAAVSAYIVFMGLNIWGKTRSDIRIGSLRTGRGRTVGVHGCGCASVQLQQLRIEWLGWLRTA
jgi:hypothetical protein